MASSISISRQQSIVDGKGGRKRRRRRRKKDVFDIPGVQKIKLTELTQKIIGCVAGENVTSEKPWMWVDKEALHDNLELHEESSEFLTLKKEILEFPGTQFLIAKQVTIVDEKSSKRRKKKKRKQKDNNIFDIPGVQKMVLTESTQKLIGCEVGENVTSERPWVFVDKEEITDNLGLCEKNSDILNLKKEIMEFSGTQFLIGYIPDESTDYDEFYLCYTLEAIQNVSDIITKLQQEQEARLNNAIYKTIKSWMPLGSECEVDQEIIKNNRPLLEVEIESQYPILPTKTEFTTAKAEDRRDGYMELKCLETVYSNVYRRKIDMHVQVAPQYATIEAQTSCTYPSNSATQYLYEIENMEELFEQYKQKIIDYSAENIDELADLLRTNFAINLYTDDYSELINDTKYMNATTAEDVKEYTSFMDVKLCREKMIADIAWHPMWSGTAAVAYCNLSPSVYKWGPSKIDTVKKAVHEENLVLVWSFLDNLHPKLILESPREIFRLSFCSFDENIIIGGCANGQIVIWDIRHRLDKVEELEILTTAQQKYRVYMNSLMGWMKNVHNIALIRPAVVSDLRYSPKSAITSVNWISPFYQFSKTGNLEEIPEDVTDHSMQFLTTSKDGSICIWDLLKKPTIQPGGFKIRKLRRLKKKPSELMVDSSPYAILHLNLKPLYRINATKPDLKRNIAISSCDINHSKISYKPINSEKLKRSTVTERNIYTFVNNRNYVRPPTSEIDIGTSEGEYLYLKWEGQDFDSGEVVNSESATILSSGKYHDGPITSIRVCPIIDVVLTVGGKVFALWHKDFPNRPIIWRKNTNLYISGEFNMYQPYTFCNKTNTGHVETWMIHASSKLPLYSIIFCSTALTSSAIHPFRVNKIIYGASDKQGIFRLFFIPEETSSGTQDQKIQKFCNFIMREIDRKKKFLQWQADWNTRNAEKVAQMDAEKLERVQEEEAKKKALEREQLEAKEREEEKKVLGPQGRYIEWVIERRQKEDENLIKTTIIKKKNIDVKDLEKKRKPLQKLDEENEKKKRRQKQRLKDGEQIFRSTVSALFPEVVKSKPIPPPDPYAGGDSPTTLEQHFANYQQAANIAEQFIVDHPFVYEYDFRKMIAAGKKRREVIEAFTVSQTTLPKIDEDEESGEEDRDLQDPQEIPNTEEEQA